MGAMEAPVVLPDEVMLGIFAAMDVKQRSQVANVSKFWNEGVHSKHLGSSKLVVSMCSTENFRLLKTNPTVDRIEVREINNIWMFEARQRTVFEMWNEMLMNLDIYLPGSSVHSLKLDCSSITNAGSEEFAYDHIPVLTTAKPEKSVGMNTIRRVVFSGSTPMLCMMERRIVMAVLEVFKEADQLIFDRCRILKATWEEFFKGVIRLRKSFRILLLSDIGGMSSTELLVQAIELSGPKLEAFALLDHTTDYAAVLNALNETCTNLSSLTLPQMAAEGDCAPILDKIRKRGCSICLKN